MSGTLLQWDMFRNMYGCPVVEVTIFNSTLEIAALRLSRTGFPGRGFPRGPMRGGRGMGGHPRAAFDFDHSRNAPPLIQEHPPLPLDTAREDDIPKRSRSRSAKRSVSSDRKRSDVLGDDRNRSRSRDRRQRSTEKGDRPREHGSSINSHRSRSPHTSTYCR